MASMRSLWRISNHSLSLARWFSSRCPQRLALNNSKQIAQLPTRHLSQKPNQTSSFKTYGKYILLTAASTAIGLALYLSGYKQIAARAQPLQTNLQHVGQSLRQHFNFIDKVVKQCASSVVYIEIKDPKKTDPETGQPMTASNGSGFIVGEDGWILTNAHVVINKPHSMVMVMLDDGTVYEATIQDADMNIDLALLKIQCDRKLPHLRLGKSADVATGEWVIALGSPLSLSHSVTAGVISSINRGAEELGLRNFSMKYIQTDAAITFGNSGGPLVNLDGDVIGVNNLRVTAGIAFAIPIDYAKRFLERTHFASPAQPMSLDMKMKDCIGITTISVTPTIKDQLLHFHPSIPDELTHGVVVWKIVAGSPAYASGLVAGDIITHINGVPVHDPIQIYNSLKQNWNKVKIDVIHLGQKTERWLNR